MDPNILPSPLGHPPWYALPQVCCPAAFGRPSSFPLANQQQCDSTFRNLFCHTCLVSNNTCKTHIARSLHMPVSCPIAHSLAHSLHLLHIPYCVLHAALHVLHIPWCVLHTALHTHCMCCTFHSACCIPHCTPTACAACSIVCVAYRIAHSLHVLHVP